MPPERRAVLLLLGLAVLGQWLRGRAAGPDMPPGEARLLAGGPSGSPRAHRESSLVVDRPLAAGERVDLDRAGVAEIARLPRVGPTLARTIVAYREAHGPFGSLEGLDRVPGIGAGLLAALAPQVAFSSVGSPSGPPAGPTGLPGPTGNPGAAPRAEESRVNLNHATVAELERLPFVGPYMAGQIVAFRERHGPFAAVDSLVNVPGVGPATLARVRARLIVE